MRAAGRGLACCLAVLWTWGSAAGAESDSQLGRALSSQGLRIEAVLQHEFRDLDRDGIKESLVHGQGDLRGASTEGALVLALHRPEPSGPGGVPVFLPSTLAWDRFVAVFRFDRGSFRWRPVLVGTYRRERVVLTAFEVVDLEGTPMVHLATEVDRRVTDRLFRLDPEGMELTLSQSRGTWVGEGFWVRGAKIFTSRGLADPFVPDPRPGLLAKTRLRWRGDAFRPEYWSLSGYGFDGDLPLDPPGEGSEALRKVQELQRAADRGLAHFRLDLGELARRRLGDLPHRVAYLKDAFGVVVPLVDEDGEPRYFVRPFLAARGPERAVWVGLDEL